MAEQTPARDDSVDRLEGFLALIAGTRASLPALQSNLDAEADALTEQVSAGQARLADFQQTVTALSEGFSGVQQEATTELAALSHAATTLAEQRLAEARARVEAAGGDLEQGVEATDAGLEQAGQALAEELDQGDATLEELEAHQAGWDADTERASGELVERAAEAETRLEQVDGELQATLETAAGYLVDGLGTFLSASFETLANHLEGEAQPAVVELLTELSRGALRVLDDYDAAVDAAARTLAEASDNDLDRAVDFVEDLHKQGRAGAQRAHDDAMEPFLDQAERFGEVASHGADVSVALQPLIPQLAAARDVAERVQEMMDVFNPFG